MKTILVIYLYFSSQGEKPVYCEMIGRGYDFEVPDFGYDKFVTLDCGKGLRNTGIDKTDLDQDIVITLNSRVLPLMTQTDKIIAENLYKKTKVLKKKSDK